MKKCGKLLSLAIGGAMLLATGCGPATNDSQSNNQLTQWTIEAVFAKAQELGFEGTWEEFRETMRGVDGVGIDTLYINENGELIVKLSSNREVNCGKVRVEGGVCNHSYGNYETGIAPTCDSMGYEQRVCSKCQDVDYKFLPETGHDWQFFQTWFEPTETEMGVGVSVCVTCNEAKLTPIPALGEEEEPGEGGGEIAEATSQLTVFASMDGYGADWLYEAIEDFEKMYADVSFEEGKLGVKVAVNDSKSSFTQIKERLVAGVAKENIFFVQTTDKELKELAGQNYLADITDILTAPLQEYGEAKTILEKLPESYSMIDGKGYYMPYSQDYWGILYNADIFEEYELTLPNTTDELITLCQEMTYRGITPMTYNGQIARYYVEWLADVWWAQYEGVSGYTDFWSGVTEKNTAIDLLSQTGRLKAMNVFHQLFANKDYIDHNAMNMSVSFTQTQANFLMSEYNSRNSQIGMIFEGEWMLTEAKPTLERMLQMYGKTPNIGMMKTPVLSSVIEKCTTIKDDATLSKVVAAIDNGETSYEGVSAQDFAFIQQARGVVSSSQRYTFLNGNMNGQQIKLAKIFLRFLSSNEQLTSAAVHGIRPMLSHELTQEQFQALDSVKQDAYAIAQSANVLPQKEEFALYQKGLRSFGDGLLVAFQQRNLSAQTYFNELIQNYKDIFNVIV